MLVSFGLKKAEVLGKELEKKNARSPKASPKVATTSGFLSAKSRFLSEALPAFWEALLETEAVQSKILFLLCKLSKELKSLSYSL